MATIETNPNAEMTRHLVAAGVFRKNPITIVDVGARWGFNSEWSVFGDSLRVICFEPDEDECRRLNSGAKGNVVYIPAALGREESMETLYETALSASSGLYKTDMDYFSRLLNRDNGIVASERKLRVDTLDRILAANNIEAIDFIKLDVEGAELDVLIGGDRFVKNNGLIGILSEIRFQEEINHCPVFWQLDQHVRQSGFRLFNLQFHHQSRRALPYPGLVDYRTAEGKRFFAYTTHGQIMDGDALYFRDFLIPANANRCHNMDPTQLLKAAALLEVYCLNDCAAELIIAFREKLDGLVDCSHLLNLLTKGTGTDEQNYEAYMDRYFDPGAGIIAGQNASASASADQLRAELNTVYTSLSWRITRPLRAFKRILRVLAR